MTVMAYDLKMSENSLRRHALNDDPESSSHLSSTELRACLDEGAGPRQQRLLVHLGTSCPTCTANLRQVPCELDKLTKTLRPDPWFFAADPVTAALRLSWLPQDYWGGRTTRPVLPYFAASDCPAPLPFLRLVLEVAREQVTNADGGVEILEQIGRAFRDPTLENAVAASPELARAYRDLLALRGAYEADQRRIEGTPDAAQVLNEAEGILDLDACDPTTRAFILRVRADLWRAEKLYSLAPDLLLFARDLVRGTALPGIEAEALTHLGLAYFDNKDYEKALDTLQEALRQPGLDQRLHLVVGHYRAFSKLHLGDIQAAEAEYQHVQGLYESLGSPLMKAQRRYLEARFDLANDSFGKAFGKLRQSAEELRQLGQLTEAVNVLVEAAQLAQRHEALASLAQLFVQLGNWMRDPHTAFRIETLAEERVEELRRSGIHIPDDFLSVKDEKIH